MTGHPYSLIKYLELLAGAEVGNGESKRFRQGTSLLLGSEICTQRMDFVGCRRACRGQMGMAEQFATKFVAADLDGGVLKTSNATRSTRAIACVSDAAGRCEGLADSTVL